MNSVRAGVFIDGHFPLRWSEQADIAENREGPAQENLALMKALAAQDAVHLEKDGEWTQESKQWERVEAKIDLLTILMARVVAAGETLPPVRRCVLTAQELEWEEAEGPAPGSRLRVELFLHPSVPLPLQLSVVVESRDETATPASVKATIQGCLPDEQDWLEKTLFRHHRRTLQARAQRHHSE